MDAALTVRQTPPQDAAVPLRLVFSRLGHQKAADYVEMLLPGVRSGEISTEGLLEARRRGRTVGAVFAQVQPGGTAVVWPPRLLPAEPQETAARLLESLCQWMTVKKVRVASALLDRVEPAEDAVLRQAGFAPLSTLLYLVSEESEFPRSMPDSPLEFLSLSTTHDDRLASIIQASYEGSLDCPGLDGLRSLDEILLGYRDSGDYAPERWFLVRHAGQDVGCLLLNDHPREEHWELVYVGLAPSARGHGWGKQMVRFGQWMTRQAGRLRLVVAVDSANRPAVEMYTASGFRAWEQRHVYFRVFGSCEK